MLKQVQHDKGMGTKDFNIIDKLISWMRLRRMLPYIVGDDTVLDFGCGYQAYFLDHIKDKIKKGIGLDYDVETKKFGKNIDLCNFHFKDKLPYPDKKFNTVFMLAVIEHIDIVKVPKLFKEIQRILKKKGTLILTTPTLRGKILLEFLAFTLGVISKEEVGDHKKYYNRRDLENLAEKYGFSIETYKTFQLGGNSLCVLKKLTG